MDRVLITRLGECFFMVGRAGNPHYAVSACPAPYLVQARVSEWVSPSYLPSSLANPLCLQWEPPCMPASFWPYPTASAALWMPAPRVSALSAQPLCLAVSACLT